MVPEWPISHGNIHGINTWKRTLKEGGARLYTGWCKSRLTVANKTEFIYFFIYFILFYLFIIIIIIIIYYYYVIFIYYLFIYFYLFY